MKKTFVTIYSIFASIVLLFAIAYFGVNIYQEQSHGEVRIDVRFQKMANSMAQTLGKSNLSDKEIQRQFENAIGDVKDFSYIQVFVNGSSIYQYPADFENQTKTKYILDKTYSKKNNNTDIRIEAGLYTLRPSSVSEYSKISFLIILVITLITIILIIIDNANGNKKSYKEIDEAPKDVDEILNMKSDNSEQASPSENTEEQTSIDKTESETEVEPESTTDEANDELSLELKESAEQIEKLETSSNKKEVEKLPIEDSTPLKISSEEPTGLFSPVTGLCWESYLSTRLESELNRAISTEIDLSLFIIDFVNLTRENPLMKQICDYLAVEFQFKDLLFEYKENDICGMKLNMNIDDSIIFAQKLIDEITQIVKDENIKVYIGISSRGIRMVSTDRILKESEEAAKHAKVEDTSTVIAFRADATKYRKFIESN